MNFWNEKGGKRLSQKFPFYNVFIEEPKIRHLPNIDLLHERSFYDELSVAEISKAFKVNARSYKIEIVDLKGSLA